MAKKKLKYDPKKCQACRTCELVCAAGHSFSKELCAALKEENISLPRVKVYGKQQRFFPIACRHCDEPACIAACIANALQKDKTTGMVTYNRDKCVGCWMCVMVCPYGAIRPNYKTKKTIRCDLCEDVDTPRCAATCPSKAITFEEVESSK